MLFRGIIHIPDFWKEWPGFFLAGQLAQRHVASGIGNPSHAVHEGKQIHRFGDFKSPFDHFLGFLGAAWFHQRIVYPLGDGSGVLFVVAGSSTRVIGNEDDHSRSADACHVQINDKIGCHVGAVLLHDPKRANSSE